MVTSFHDLRIGRCLASLEAQDLPANQLIVTDGSLDLELGARIADLAYRAGARLVYEPGSSVARARNLALDAADPGTEAFAFLDTDQRAPAGWLRTLEAGLGQHGWVGGPTRPEVRLPLVQLKERRLYAAARADPLRVPMGNSLWRAAVFEKAGRFDERLDRGGEDWDLALRASAAGFTGGVIEDAWVHHDLTGLRSTWQVLRKQFRYDVGGAMAYLKNRALARRLRRRPPRVAWHWTDLASPFSKAAAVPVAWWRLRRR